MNKKLKVAILTFVVLGVSGVAILKVKEYYTKRRVRSGKVSKNNLANQLFDLPDDLK
jgi:hypothetical protein